MATAQLLTLLPSTYAIHSDNVVYNTAGHDYDSTDYSIEILPTWSYEIRHTGNTVEFTDIEDVLMYVTE